MDPEDGTVPLDESYAETVDLLGRTYQKYALTNGTYFAPIDEEEISRLELMHSVLCRVFDDRLIFPPVGSPSRILECGCGAGDWAVDVARRFPDCEVLGIDLSPHMIPDDLPPNLEIQIDDLNGRFTFSPDQFDVVHSQMMAGGWCQMVEIYFNAQSDNGTLERDHGLSRWSSQYLNTLHPHKDPRAALQLPGWMRSAGFTEVESRLLTLPMCAWPSETRERNIGAANSENVAQLLRSLALYPFTRLRGMSIEDFDSLVEQARREARDPSFKAYFPLYVCIGRKPQR
ncbi:methyltransferase [Hirsutella rhossiliensis]|uniref:Methyltransferase domain-containing protein n=1 Tax=Hirsutella rhossiliensis TaxID=111463 RepID=A0A9P8N1R7_9HYPO|nr:methyltransferase domain-containing protein [Hirsutella rhossiliensis]KAH0966623.1 methyltransferase domain-containing protein [Hirsutella rhossiliensis]